MKKQLSKLLAFTCLLTALPFASCADNVSSTRKENVLRVASWDEYLDMGGEVYADDPENPDPDLKAFKDWYKETDRKSVV